MANHKSAIKRIRQSERNRQRNRVRKTMMKNTVKAAEQSVKLGEDRDVVLEKLRQAISTIDKTASKGVIHKNTASRKISRLSRRVHGLLSEAEATA